MIMHKSKNPRFCERGAGIRAGVFSPPKSHRPAMPAEICLEPQRLFESVVGFASGGQFCPSNSPKAPEIGLSLEPQQVLRGYNRK